MEVEWNKIKYSRSAAYSLNRLLDAGRALDLPESYSADLSNEAFRGLVNAALAKSTWGKYASGWNAFCCFEEHHQTSYRWPLSIECWRAFAVWCVTFRKLQTSSTKSYFSALKFVHSMKGVPCVDYSNDILLNLVLKGAQNMAFSQPPRPNTRRVVTFSLLRTLGHRIACTSWKPLSRQVIWSACTAAFFASARLGELLASKENWHDPTADLTWSDVSFKEQGSVLIRLKNPKSGDIGSEFLDLFPFPGFNCCPVLGLKALLMLQKTAGLGLPHQPVFRYGTGINLTTSGLNKVLSELLKDICIPGKDSITCHSFRAGIPTALSLVPELTSDADIKGWGRWNSECYSRYTRLRHDQKSAIFQKITSAILSMHPD